MSTATETKKEATRDDLDRAEDKAEMIAGRIVHRMANGRKPSQVAARIDRSLDAFAGATGRGEAYTGYIGYAVGRRASSRQSFSPDAFDFLGPFPESEMWFLERAPHFAVEARSENDPGEAAEAAMFAKRADDPEAETLVVWDVEMVKQRALQYRPEDPRPTTFKPGHQADAEPALSGWRLLESSLTTDGDARSVVYAIDHDERADQTHRP